MSCMEKCWIGFFAGLPIGIDGRSYQQEAVEEEISKRECSASEDKKVRISLLAELLGHWHQCEFYHHLQFAASSWKYHS